METKLKLDTVKTTFKLTREAVDDLDFLAKTLGKTKRKVIDYIIMELYSATDWPETFFSDVVKSVNFESEKFIRGQYSLSRQYFDHLIDLAQHSECSRDALLDSTIKVAKSFITGENPSLKHQISLLSEKNSIILDVIDDVFLKLPLLNSAEMLVGLYTQLSHAWIDLVSASQKIGETLVWIAAQEDGRPCESVPLGGYKNEASIALEEED